MNMSETDAVRDLILRLDDENRRMSRPTDDITRWKLARLVLRGEYADFLPLADLDLLEEWRNIPELKGVGISEQKHQAARIQELEAERAGHIELSEALFKIALDVLPLDAINLQLELYKARREEDDDEAQAMEDFDRSERC